MRRVRNLSEYRIIDNYGSTKYSFGHLLTNDFKVLKARLLSSVQVICFYFVLVVSLTIECNGWATKECGEYDPESNRPRTSIVMLSCWVGRAG